MSSSFDKVILKFKKSSFMRYGLPFLILMVGGSFALSSFTRVRYDVSSHYKQLGLSDELKEKILKKEKKSLEQIYEEVTKEVDVNNWKNVRAPRPWESDNKEYKELIEQRIEEAKKSKNKTIQFWTGIKD